MKGTLITYDGRRYELPMLTQWRLQYGTGSPCDSFEVRCPCGTGRAEVLGDAVYFEATENGVMLFRGVVDEYRYGWNNGGADLLVTGRSMAALLLDNEAAPADYQTATLDDILRDHVSPYGIEVAQRGNIPPVPWFSVESGSSEWQVLRSFAQYHGGTEPRFDPAGRLVLGPWQNRKKYRFDDKTPVTEVAYGERRYGTISEVLVQDRARKTRRRVVNQPLADRGYRCRRVINMPGRSSYQEMRYSGEYQLAQSAIGRETLELTVPASWTIWPGDVVELSRKKPALEGLWRVRGVERLGDVGGIYTKMTLEQETEGG